MTPEQASAAGKFVEIETEYGDRPTAHFFEVPGGFVFADPNWADSFGGTHPFHFIECEFKQHVYIENGQTFDVYITDKSPPFDPGDRELCRENIRLDIGM